MKFGACFLIAFLIVLILDFLEVINVSKFYLGLLSIPSLHFTFLKFGNRFPEALARVGRYTYSIYLLNTVIIGGLSLFMPYLGIPFNYYTLLILFILGVVLPILNKNPYYRQVQFLGWIM